MKQYDLKTAEGRQQASTALVADCLKAFEKAGIRLCDHATVRIDTSYLEIGIIELNSNSSYFGKTAFASDISFYAFNGSRYGGRENSINFGSAGAFDPSDKASYWRTLHAAELIRNWDKACEICNEFCAKYEDLQQQFIEANK